MGIKGTDKTVSSLGSVEKGLKNTAAVSFEAKAAIIGAMYALEQFFAKSGAAGTSLTNFNALLGGGTKTLQQYQYASRQVGVSNEETMATFKNLSEVASKLYLGTGAPSGFGQLQMKTGALSRHQIEEMQSHPELLLQKLQEYAGKEKNVALRNTTLKSFGLGDATTSALIRGAYKPSELKKAPTYSDKEVGQLDKANIAWSNLGNKISMAVGRLNAAHGGQIVKEFSMLVDMGLKFADTLLKITERAHVFEEIDKVFGPIQSGASALIATIAKFGDVLVNVADKTNIIGTAEKHFENLKNVATDIISTIAQLGAEFINFGNNSKLFENIGKDFGNIIQIADSLIGIFVNIAKVLIDVGEKLKIFDTVGAVLGKIAEVTGTITGGIASGLGAVEKGTKDTTGLAGVFSGVVSNLFGSGEKKPELSDKVADTKLVSNVGGPQSSPPNLRLVTPSSPLLNAASKVEPNVASAIGGKSNEQSFDINQTLNFAHEGKDSAKTSESVKKAVRDAFRQLGSQVQGT